MALLPCWPVYLAAIGLGPLEIGLVATLAQLAAAAMTLGIGLLAARISQRTLLMVASALMIATGLAFALSGAFAVVVPAALPGTSIRLPATSASSSPSSMPSWPASRQLSTVHGRSLAMA